MIMTDVARLVLRVRDSMQRLSDAKRFGDDPGRAFDVVFRRYRIRISSTPAEPVGASIASPMCGPSS